MKKQGAGGRPLQEQPCTTEQGETDRCLQMNRLRARSHHGPRSWTSGREVFGHIYATVGQDPRDSKSNRLHVDIIFQFASIHSRYILSIDSSKMIGKGPEDLSLN